MTGAPPQGGAAGAEDGSGAVVRASAALLASAFASDDAEETGVYAAEVIADPERAISLLGGPDAWSAARNAVVQRYGRVGALLVLGFEERWRDRHTPRPSRITGADAEVRRRLEALLDGFHDLDATGLDDLLFELDRAAGAPGEDASAETRRWLHVTYAVAARDGTDAAHRAYMEALDRVLRQARSRIAC